LRAQDINGIRLGMTVQEVARLFPSGLQRIVGGDQFEATANGIEYNFGFSSQGHLYRIDSSQQLGSFVPNQAFGITLTQKLAEKYGAPQSNSLPDGAAFWSFVEPYVATGGLRLMRGTESLSAMLSGGYGQPVKARLETHGL